MKRKLGLLRYNKKTYRLFYRRGYKRYSNYAEIGSDTHHLLIRWYIGDEDRIMCSGRWFYVPKLNLKDTIEMFVDERGICVDYLRFNSREEVSKNLVKNEIVERMTDE
jgi:hypothetical protein